MLKTAGRFTFDTETQVLSGPAEYMKERGNVRLARILAGQDVLFNTTAYLSPDAETAILVSLQTDYAAYCGEREMAARMERAK